MKNRAGETHSAWLQVYIDSPQKQQMLYKKTLFVVVLAQIFGGAGLSAGVTVGSLLAQDMLGSDSAAGMILLVSGLLVAFAPADSMLFMISALALLGIGWNFGLISGTALIIDATHPSRRAKTQGSADVLLALSGAIGGVLSGIITTNSSFATLSIIGAILSLLIIPVIVWARKKNTA